MGLPGAEKGGLDVLEKEVPLHDDSGEEDADEGDNNVDGILEAEAVACDHTAEAKGAYAHSQRMLLVDDADEVEASAVHPVAVLHNQLQRGVGSVGIDVDAVGVDDDDIELRVDVGDAVVLLGCMAHFPIQYLLEGLDHPSAASLVVLGRLQLVSVSIHSRWRQT